MKKRIWIFALLAVLLLAGALGLEIYRSSHHLTVSAYQVHNSKLTQPLRVLQLSDLHNASFGPENSSLLEAVRKQAPDLLLLTGDLVNGDEPDTRTAAALVAQLASIAPVYLSLGNHEQMHQQNFGSDLTAVFEAAGATVLEYSWEDVDIAGQALRIGGASGYCLPGLYLSTGEASPEECAFLEDFQDTVRCTLLMAHMPACWIRNDGISYWQSDLVFSGHAHGGQVILGDFGGLYAPDMGLFPGPLRGLHPSGDGQRFLVLSAGLGSSAPIPRLNNPPEILVLDILP